MRTAGSIGLGAAAAASLLMLCGTARAAEHVTLRDGFELDCARVEAAGSQVRLYLLSHAGSAAGAAGDSNFIEVEATDVVRRETIPDLPAPTPKAVSAPVHVAAAAAPVPADVSRAKMRDMLAAAGQKHNVDADLLASVVQAESNGQVRAVSRAGAQGLMQLMPATAATLGVKDTFAPDQNIVGGTAYLDALLTRYHDDLPLALAAYNAGPGAVDHYHGIPPFPETRAYVARVIREFNRRKRAAARSGVLTAGAE